MSLRHGPIDPYGSDVWSGDRLEVPAVPPSFLVGCSIIDIRYILMVNMNNIIEPVHEISTNVPCATSKASDQPTHTHSLIRAFASHLSIL